jgi:hypothetical protein
MSEFLLKFNQLDAFQRQEVLNFINFLLSKTQQKQQDALDSQNHMQQVASDDAYNFFESAGLMENRAVDADQLRRDAWKINH